MKNIAIIGSGISGLTSAYLLSREHNVTVFEKNNYIGGHTATKDIEVDGKCYAIDTGFIVYNERTYPNFIKLLNQLGITEQKTEMSFSVMNPSANLEYNGSTINTLFAQRSNLFKPSFWRLILEILRFNKLCKALYERDDIDVELTLGDFLKQHKFNQAFSQNYILPMGAAIWSSSLVEMTQFQLKFFVRFFYNHGLLDIQNRPQWFVIPGGSKQYIYPLIQSFENNIELNSQIKSVSRTDSGVTLLFEDGHSKQFDEVVFACHSDQALHLLSDSNAQEQEILSSMPYRDNQVVLHTDTNLLPKRRLAWASWNYHLDSNQNRPACVTYNMNILQGLESDTTFCVTLNNTDRIDTNKILQTFNYSHPIFNQNSLAAQQRRLEICGKNNTYFAGAYWHNGFHEDGVRSAVEVAQRFGISL
ncbi:NAD(P)/FAD-dependent oxidoreductase [Vibrio algivorus]|uniref:FAD-dependent oxidoreductase n=1 Tax=Vibrio algivorus TaxID=1667024 RepID=A0A557PAZ9_9VIBR|nr:FAD-dependent oxidoreductase [Vibrio algivorus]TVO37831.1 FAD-dependent oxidoreductase [Vibrio algivorus]